MDGCVGATRNTTCGYQASNSVSAGVANTKATLAATQAAQGAEATDPPHAHGGQKSPNCSG